MNVITTKANTYDAIVIGSGISGGWAVKELTEKGMQTLVLEAGQTIVPERDYVEHVPVWDVKFRGMRDRKYEEVYQPVQRHIGDEWNSKFFVNDLENPYTTPQDQPYLFLRGRHVGGRSVMWGRQSYRWSEMDFESNLKDGHGVDWPVRYKDVEPWYDYVEDFIGVSGQAEGLPQLPDGKFLPPMEMNCAEVVVKQAIAEKFPDRRLTIGRTAILTVPHRGRAACHYCGPCARGCITRSYFSSLHSTLPAAEATGKMTLRPFSVVHSLIFNSVTRRITGVRVIDGQTKAPMEFHAKVVFLCASTLESARILMNSATSEFPTGLANSSGELGHNLMDHIMHGGASGIIAGRQVSQADPDGYTILIATNSMMVAQLTTSNANLDMLRDLKAVASIAPQANIVVASPGLEVKSLADVIALAKARHLTYASPGAGSVPQLFFQHFLTTVAKAPMTHVPFQGAAGALTATMANQTDVAVVTLPPAVSFVNSGKLKGIAVTTKARSAALPQIPTVVESGYTGISSTVWAAIFVPAKTPDAIRARLSEAALKVAAMPDVQAKLRALGYETDAVPGEQFQQDIAKELRVWTNIVAAMKR